MIIRNYELYYQVFHMACMRMKQKDIAASLGVSQPNVSRMCKKLVSNGILKVSLRTSFKIYTWGPGARGFVKEVIANRGGIEDLSSKSVVKGKQEGENLSTPPLEYFQMGSCRAHNLQYTFKISKPTYYELRSLENNHVLPNYLEKNRFPPGMDFVKDWNTKGGTLHKLWEVKLEQWNDPATVHAIFCKDKTVTLQIVIPATYLLSHWIEDFRKVEEFFFEIAKGLADMWKHVGYQIDDYSFSKIEKEFGFWVPVFETVHDMKSMKISDTLWLDFSTGAAELETNSMDEALGLKKSLPMLPKLSEFVSRLREIEHIVQEHGTKIDGLEELDKEKLEKLDLILGKLEGGPQGPDPNIDDLAYFR